MLKKKQRIMIAKIIRKDTGIKLPQAIRIAKAIVRGKMAVVEAIQKGMDDKCPNLIIEMNQEQLTWENRLRYGNVYVEGPKGTFNLW